MQEICASFWYKVFECMSPLYVWKTQTASSSECARNGGQENAGPVSPKCQKVEDARLENGVPVMRTSEDNPAFSSPPFFISFNPKSACIYCFYGPLFFGPAFSINL